MKTKGETAQRACAQTFRVLNSGDCTQEVEIFISDEGDVCLDLHRFDDDCKTLEVKGVPQMKSVLKAVLQFLDTQK